MQKNRTTKNSKRRSTVSASPSTRVHASRTSSHVASGMTSFSTASVSTSSRVHSATTSSSRSISTSAATKRSGSVASRVNLSSRRTTDETPSVYIPQRNLDLHEYQSKDLMTKHNIRVQRGIVADTPEAAFEAATHLKETGAEELVVKAQVHAGGRGKGFFRETGFKGGVKITTEPADIRKYAEEFLGKHLVTKQTTEEGQLVRKVLVHEGINFDAEKYFAIVMDRAHKGPVIVVSPQGGVNIEEVAEESPDAVKMVPINIKTGITDTEAGEAADFLGFQGKVKEDAVVQMKNLYELFMASDATQVEINPFVLATNGSIYCVDAKINFDDNAQFRQKDVFALRDESMEDARDVAASKFNLNYVGLEGNIGCMVNGAGLAMATMDIIKLRGGWPANFLDVGGGATAKQVEEAFKILTADPKVEAILVNIFGGIMKCDVIAEGIITAARNLDLKVPLIVRLEGTNVQKGVEMLNNSGLAIISAKDLDDAAVKAVAAVEKH